MSTKNKKRKKTISCGAVVWRLRNGRLELLLVKQLKHKDLWGIPKGHMDNGESLSECALREIREETGVAVWLDERLPDCAAYFKNEDKTVVSYLARPIDPNIEPTHDDPRSEVADASWFPVDRLPKIHAYQQQLIATAIGRLQLSLGFLKADESAGS